MSSTSDVMVSSRPSSARASARNCQNDPGTRSASLSSSTIIRSRRRRHEQQPIARAAPARKSWAAATAAPGWGSRVSPLTSKPPPIDLSAGRLASRVRSRSTSASIVRPQTRVTVAPCTWSHRQANAPAGVPVAAEGCWHTGRTRRVCISNEKACRDGARSGRASLPSSYTDT